MILAILLPDIYIYWRYLRQRKDMSAWLHIIWWIPGTFLTVYTIGLTLIRDFAPNDITWLDTYLFLTGLIVAPKLVFVTCSAAGLAIKRIFRLQRNYGNYAGNILVLFTLYFLFYGSMIGNEKLKIKHVAIEHPDLPKSFDGYRIAQFTDAHVGSINKDFLRRVVDSINAQKADAVAFTGDLQNLQPSELDPFGPLLSSIKAKDGVYSIMGNHDYSMYINDTPAAKSANERELKRRERSYGWNLLLNENRIVKRGNDSIAIAGEENGGGKRFPKKDDIAKAMHGIRPGTFTVMLQHDPSAWRRSILPRSTAQLTLSGHTHGGQISIFGLRPTRLTGKEDLGLYHDGNRYLYVSGGIGGLVPFRFGVSPEITVITLHRKKK